MRSKKGDTIKEYNLYKMNFKGCAHCNKCAEDLKTPNCALKDDLTEVIDEMLTADTTVVASPVHCWSFSGCMSGALDRWYAFFKEDSYSGSKVPLIKGKNVLGVFTAGGDSFNGMDLCVSGLKSLCAYGQANYIGTLSATYCTTPELIVNDKKLQETAQELAKKL